MVAKEEYIKKLNLHMKIENGYLGATYPCKEIIPKKYLPTSAAAPLFSFAYYLLPGERFNPLHKLGLYESWQYCDGGAVRIYTISPKGDLEATVVGPGGKFIHIVPPGYWMCAHLDQPSTQDFSLVSHFGIPSFSPTEHVKGTEESLIKEFPQHQTFIETFSWKEDVIHEQT